MVTSEQRFHDVNYYLSLLKARKYFWEYFQINNALKARLMSILLEVSCQQDEIFLYHRLV